MTGAAHDHHNRYENRCPQADPDLPADLDAGLRRDAASYGGADIDWNAGSTLLIDWQLSVIALAVCPVLFVWTHRYGARLRRQWHEMKAHDSSAMGVVQEVLGAVRVVKAFGQEEHEQERFVRRSEERLRSQVRVAYLEGRFDLFVGLTIALGSAATLVIGVWHVQAGALTVGSLLVLMTYLAQIYEPLKTISKKLGDLQSGLASADRAFRAARRAPRRLRASAFAAVEQGRGNDRVP